MHNPRVYPLRHTVLTQSKSLINLYIGTWRLIHYNVNVKPKIIILKIFSVECSTQEDGEYKKYFRRFYISHGKIGRCANFSAFNFIPSIPFNDKQTTGFLKFFIFTNEHF